MAITKTIFTGSTSAQRSAEMLAYLQANAANFFDDITADSNGNISCTIDGVTAILLPYVSGTYLTVKLKNDVSIQAKFSNDMEFVKGYHSSNGIMLTGKGVTIAVSVNNAGSPVIAVKFRTDSTNGYYSYNFGDFSQGVTWTHPWIGNTDSGSVESLVAKSAALTVFVPCVFDSALYSESLGITPYSEYAKTECILDLNGVQYAYDGALALKG